ncbi:Lrp/AsnC family transcriptional regulator [Bifidobacterium crudilactis]|jgi:DNA-binding Lrp family transcriptional regulator|uniref:Lrp/AsnC family transcriptional regulator n=1 Tax=Bifidobacterium crudilactis TaxID=327277 RepID=UPI000551C2BF|nr:winged helix-turn-helix transcriptional regulator [Bifidobacterium crudilactis]
MSSNIAIDGVDRAIINILLVDGRISNVELAARVGLTPAPCLRRIKRLENEGVITGYRVMVDPVMAGRAFCVYMEVQIVGTSREIVEQFETVVASYPETTEVRRLFGPVDYLIRVEVADSAAYERFQTEKMYPLPAVRRIESYPTMRVIKSSVDG